ncbi:MAG: stage II sporulation protein M [Hadesarchaea archaeon]|nr:stage II sporulation protein M [Hadesarchaea archaeon]
MSENDSLIDRIKENLGVTFPRVIQRNSRLISLVTVFFIGVICFSLVASLVGDNPVNEAISDFTEPSRERIENLAGDFSTSFDIARIVLVNNSVSVLSIIGLGIIFGVIPILALILNGFIIGFIIGTSNLPIIGTLSVVLPHGFLELSGVLIAISCGIKLGIGSIKSVIERSLDPLREEFMDVKKLLPGIFLLILIAGFIEGFFSTLYGPIVNYLKIIFSLVVLALILLWFSGEHSSSLSGKSAR